MKILWENPNKTVVDHLQILVFHCIMGANTFIKEIYMTSKQRAYLRGLANPLTAIFQIGKNGLNDNLIKQVDDALEARELIKLSVLETAPDDNRTLAEALATSTNSVLVQVVGNKITLYRTKKKNSKIQLPEGR